jgi:hypothetical protein
MTYFAQSPAMGIINTKPFFSASMEYHALLFGMHA